MNQRKVGMIISYVQMVVSLIVSLIYTPYMIQILGQNEYGLYNTVVSTISMLSVLSLGFNSGYIRYYAKYRINNQRESIYRLNGLFLIIFSVIGVVALICGIFIYRNIHIVFSDGLSISEYALAKKLLFISVLNLAISFPMSVFMNIISAHEQFILLKSLGVLKTVGGPLVTLPLLLAGYRSVAIILVTFSFSIITDCAYFFYTIFKLKEKFWFTNFEKGLFKQLFGYTIFIAINMIIDQINWNLYNYSSNFPHFIGFPACPLVK